MSSNRSTSAESPATASLGCAPTAGPEPEPIPALPPEASVEERDAHWFKHVYRGDHFPQLTWRAVLMGGVLGMFMSISNLYTILKLGLSFGVAITSCVLSYVIWNAFRGLSGYRLTPMTILENNCMQSTATAAGASTGHTLGLAFGALLLLTGEHTWWGYVTLYVLFAAALGVFIAVPMKRQMINVERLTFPSGVAAAETLRSLHAHGREAIRKAIALMCALFLGAIFGFYKFSQDTFHWADRIYQATFHIPDLIPFDRLLNPFRARGITQVGLGYEPSALMLGAGAFMGLRVTLSMLGSSIVVYYVLMPWFVSANLPVYLAGAEHQEAILGAQVGDGAVLDPRKWAVWGGTSIMLFSSLAALAVQWRTLARSFNIFKKAGGPAAGRGAASIEVPIRWVIAGVIPAGIGLIIVCGRAFGMSWWLGAIAVAMSFVTALIAGRATGETDFTPTGAMGKLTQLLYAVLAQGDRVVNLMSAGATSASSAAAADLLTDLKSGYLLGAHPRKQFIAQFCGIFFGVLAIVPAWYLLVPDKAALEAYPMPATEMWRAVAIALTKGLNTIPITALYSVVIGGMVGMAIPVIGAMVPRSAPYLPSAIGLGLAWVVPFQICLAFTIGALIAWAWGRMHKKSADVYVFPIAAGFIAGESIVLALMAMGATGMKLMPKFWARGRIR